MKLLVFGKTGQVARALGQYDRVTLLGRDEADLSKPAACARIIADTDADAVINAAAYTAVDRAEEEEALAGVVNGKAPAAMARAAAARGLPFVHISTDYVFDGTGMRPWHETDPVSPQNTYGCTKLAGEDGVRAAGGTHAILRSSWVISAHGQNFVKTMLRLGAERDRLTIVADQIGGPTPAAAIAMACMQIARQLTDDPEKSGTYHFSGAPDISWADFAREIFVQAGVTCDVADIPSSAYPTPAARPLNSRLDNHLIKAVFDINRPDWRKGLVDILEELGKDKA